MIQKVIKGVDEEIEFKGFKGRYFYQLAGAILGLMLLTFLLYMVGFSSFILIFLAILLAVGAYLYIKFQMDKHGKWGHIHSQHSKKRPKYILHNQAFYKIISQQ